MNTNQQKNIKEEKKEKLVQEIKEKTNGKLEEYDMNRILGNAHIKKLVESTQRNMEYEVMVYKDKEKATEVLTLRNKKIFDYMKSEETAEDKGEVIIGKVTFGKDEEYEYKQYGRIKKRSTLYERPEFLTRRDFVVLITSYENITRNQGIPRRRNKTIYKIVIYIPEERKHYIHF